MDEPAVVVLLLILKTVLEVVQVWQSMRRETREEDERNLEKRIAKLEYEVRIMKARYRPGRG